MSPRTRRNYLRSVGTIAVAATAGCSGVRGLRERLSASEPPPIEWPPARPEALPTLEDVSDLSPPTIGKTSATPAQVFEDLGTMMAGKLFHEELPGLQYDIERGRVKIIYRDYPLPSSDWSYPVAIAARSVQHHAGEEAFWEFSKRVTRDYRPSIYYTKERILDAAETAGASRDTVQNDVESWRFYPIVERDRRLARELKLDGVPTTVIGPEGEQFEMDGAGAGRMIWFLEHKIEDADSDPSK